MINAPTRRLTILGIYPHTSFWSMGRGRGAPSFSLAPVSLAAAGHRVVLLLPAGESTAGPFELDGVELVRHAGFPGGVFEDATAGRISRLVHRVRTYLRYRRSAGRAALDLAREIRPDVVVGYDDYGVPVARAVAHRLGVPNVSRFFGTYLLPHLGNRVRLWYHFVPAIAYATAAAYYVINDDGSGGDRVARRLGAPPERIRFWRNGVDRGLYRPETASNPRARAQLRGSLGLGHDGPVLLTMSRLVREKHVERIIRALPEVAAAHPDACLLVLGDGPEGSALQAEARRLGVESQVRFLGAVDRTELPTYLNVADVFVAASDRTNAANPTYEAMICARPVVLLDTGRTRDLIEDGVTGVLVAEPRGLGPALAALLADAARAARIGSQARAWALAHLLTPEERQALEVELIERAAEEWLADATVAHG